MPTDAFEPIRRWTRVFVASADSNDRWLVRTAVRRVFPGACEVREFTGLPELLEALGSDREVVIVSARSNDALSEFKSVVLSEAVGGRDPAEDVEMLTRALRNVTKDSR